MDLLSGLDDFGLKGFEGTDVLKEQAIDHDKQENKTFSDQKHAQIEEKTLLFDKTVECFVCGNKIKNKTLKTGKVRLLSTDVDLRSRYDCVEPLKYDVISCNKCGYTAVSRYFVALASSQKKAILENISAKYVARQENKDIIDYEDAIARYKLALLNAVIKNSKMSERAYTCLRAGWMVRSYIEELESNQNSDQEKIIEMKALEESFINSAYKGYMEAVSKETFPISGMDEHTINYLLAALALRFEDFNTCSRCIASILTSPLCSSRVKDKARSLKEDLREKMLARKNAEQ